MRIHKQSIRGKVKKEFVVVDNGVRYYNIKLGKHIVANYVSGAHVDMFVEGYNNLVGIKQPNPKKKPRPKKKFGFTIVR